MLNEKISEAVAKCRKKIDPLFSDNEIIVLIGRTKYSELVSEANNYVRVYSNALNGHNPDFYFQGCKIVFSHNENEIKVQIRDKYTLLTKKSITVE